MKVWVTPVTVSNVSNEDDNIHGGIAEPATGVAVLISARITARALFAPIDA
jgi:hypothetical protein